MELVFSQIVGFLAFCIFVMSMQQKTKTRILFLQVISFSLYALQYFLIKAYPGMVTFIINMIRSIVFYYSSKKNKNNKIIFVSFITISLVSGIVTYQKIYDVLPIMASLSSVIFTWQPNTKVLRFGQIGICMLWIVYDVFVQAYIGILTESLIIISTIVAILNIDYNIDLSKKFFKYYIKIKFNANDDVINFSNNLPRIKIIKIRAMKNKI